MKIQNIKKAVARIIRNVRWILTQDLNEIQLNSHERSVMANVRLDHIEDLTKNLNHYMNEAINEYDFDEVIDDRISDHDFETDIEEGLNEMDFTDWVKGGINEMDFTDWVRDAINEYDFDVEIGDQVRDAINAFDFSEEIETALEDQEPCYEEIVKSVVEKVKRSIGSAKLSIEIVDEFDDSCITDEQQGNATRSAMSAELEALSDPLLKVIALVSGDENAAK